MRRLSIFVILFALGSCLSKSQEFKSNKIRAHIETLAADAMEGRGTGTRGEEAAARYIQQQFTKLKLTPMGDSNTFVQRFPYHKGLHGQGEAGIASNIIGFLDNRSGTTIVIGAHYDHLGTDGQGTSLDANPQNRIHNGADDNASGVAGVIELARYFSTNRRTENNNFLFICFSGEELGLLGSKHFTEHPTVDLRTVNFMINLDMVGRLNEQTKDLFISGTGTSPVWEPLIKKVKTELEIKTDSSGTGPSDHTSFYLKDIPVLHFFTGSHPDYHKPSDDIDKLNIEGQIQVLNVIIDMVENLDKRERIAFLQTRNRMQVSRASFKVTLGIMPDYSNEATGLKVDGVIERKPAHIAGIKTGDIIMRLGDYPVKDIYAYMDALGKFEKGQTILVRIKRGNEEKDVQLTF